MPIWTHDTAPTLDEAAAALPEYATSILGTVRGATEPAAITPLARYSSLDLTPCERRTIAYAATVEWIDHNPFNGGPRAWTLIQISEGGLAPDGWATWDTYKIHGALTEPEALDMIQVILHRMPVHVEGGDL